MANAPGVNVTVNAPSSSPIPNAPTGTWFVTGVTAGGPSGIAVPVNSLQDYTNYFGGRTVASAYLYDSLDVYFREGGIKAYVSNVIASNGTPAKATCAIKDGAGTPVTVVTLTAAGNGTWANSASGSTAGLIASVTNPAGGGYILSIAFNGNTLGTSPTLFTGADAVNWIGSLSTPGLLVTATVGTSTTIAAPVTAAYFTGGVDGTSVQETDYTTALTAFTQDLGVGQVSCPGHTTATGWKALGDHAAANNRVAILDAQDSSSASTLIGYASALQTGGANPITDSSYAALFAPWVTTPGIGTTTPNSVAPVFYRTVPPSPFVAANIASNDASNDCNVPAAGLQNGSIDYGLNVTQTYSASDRAALNTAGVNVIRNINGALAIYGFRSLASDTNWTALNNVRFRMQIIRDLDVVAEPFVFAEIDGKGQIFARLAGAISGQCQLYWLRNSIYGASVDQAFTVNCGPQVNTPATIAAGQLNAQVNLRMAPQAELVSVIVTKYLASATLPSY